MSDPRQPTKPTKPTETEVNTQLAFAHGEIKGAAEEVVQALDKLIKKHNELNKEVLRVAIENAMRVPTHGWIKETMHEILDDAKKVLDIEITGLVMTNDQLKQQIKQIKEKKDLLIKEIQEQTKRSGLRR